MRLRKALSCWRGQPRRGRVWRGPSSFYRTARKYVTPHIRLGLRQATFSPGRRLWIVRTFSTHRPSSGRNNDSGHLPPGEGIPQKGRHTSATSDRTPPPSALKGSHLPLHRGGKLKSTGAGPSEERPPLLERAAPKGPGVEGTIFVLSDCPEICYAPHPSWLTPSHLLPREKALDCANL